MILFVRIPNPPRSADGIQARGSLWREMRFGWDYVVSRKGLLSLLMYFLAINFLTGIIQPLFTPLILDNWPPNVLGYVSTVMGIGMLAGTLAMSAWGGGRRKIYTLLVSGAISGIFLSAVAFSNTIPSLAVCAFGFMFCMPLMNASSQAIWQAKVAP